MNSSSNLVSSSLSFQLFCLKSFQPTTTQMPGHVTDKCHCLHHKIQDLIDSNILPPPKKSSTLSNHRINYINTSSTIFDLTHYIIPVHLPKPIVPIPDESSISILEFEPTSKQNLKS
ncbi:hypothetical protein RHMOL_Rhmol01G0215900 [Rhododendron molle]|uniref:Uncharacterized protein n=1 Tax=Rhododendron molle TaxID=49168 RepID=A0ACC0Q4J8_RHOML|nr:hypothetical protein RHMOL_Rhmol01G0215900 [Rhododendron molle]